MNTRGTVVGSGGRATGAGAPLDVGLRGRGAPLDVRQHVERT